MGRIVVLLAPSILVACVTAPARDVRPTTPEPSPTWAASISAGLEARARAIRRTPEGGYVAAIPGGTARFSSTVARVQSGDEAVGLRFVGWGRDGRLRGGGGEPGLGACAGGAEVDPRGDCVRRLEIPRDGMVEWWAGRADGVWQGWDLHERPDGVGLVRIVIAVEGAEAVDAGDDVDLYDGAGALWRYGGLQAWDADGDELTVDMAVEGAHIVLTIDDTGAQWPLLVDPVLSTPTTALEESAVDANGYFGLAVAGAGDVDGDGYDDVIVGAPYDYVGSSGDLGTAYVYHGSATGVSTTATTSLQATGGEYFGFSVDGAGDVNGDGYDDVIVGGIAAGAVGRAYVYLGSAAGVSATGTQLMGFQYEDYFGQAVAGAGDVDGDGYDDVIVGAIHDDTGGTSAGRVYVYHGSATGVSTSYSRALTGPSGGQLGYAVDGAGDVNGDGYDDVVLGAPYYNGDSTGRVYVHLGSATGVTASAAWTQTGDSNLDYLGYDVSSAGDVNGDGYADVAVSAPYAADFGHVRVYHGSAAGLSTTTSTTLTGTADGILGDGFGYAVSDAGDINGDGYGDLIVGSNVSLGNVYLHEGSATGLEAKPTTELLASASFMCHGRAVGGAGDVDGDGKDDVIVGAPCDSIHKSNAGRAFVYHGYAGDNDGDGLGSDVDCDDDDASVGGGSAWYADADEDGFGGGAAVTACAAPTGYVADGSDCDDADGSITDGTAWYADTDADGFGAGSGVMACSAPTGHVANADDCDDADARFNPGAAEADCADRNDYNCDGSVAYEDADADGWAACEECNDADSLVNPDAVEVCNEIDDDCDGTIDDRVTITLYADADGDGWGDAGAPAQGCDEGGGLVTDASDCDDADANAHPGANDVAGDGIDQDCDGADATSTGGDTDEPGDTDGADDDTDCPDTGCGCAAGASPTSGLAGLVLALLTIRRRRSTAG